MGLGTPTPALAQQTASIEIPFSTSTAPVIIAAYARKYDVSATEMAETLQCESRFKPNALGDYRDSEPTSFGVAQIHLPAHPEVTRAQALDPIWSIEWTAKEFAAGRAWQWTCHRNLFGSRR